MVLTASSFFCPFCVKNLKLRSENDNVENFPDDAFVDEPTRLEMYTFGYINRNVSRNTEYT